MLFGYNFHNRLLAFLIYNLVLASQRIYCFLSTYEVSVLKMLQAFWLIQCLYIGLYILSLLLLHFNQKYSKFIALLHFKKMRFEALGFFSFSYYQFQFFLLLLYLSFHKETVARWFWVSCTRFEFWQIVF